MKKTILSLLSAATLFVCAPAQVWANNAFAPQEMYSINATSVIAGISASNIRATSAAVNIDFSAPSGNTSVVVRYGTGSLVAGSAPLTVLSSGAGIFSRRITLSNLTPNTVYYYKFEVTDANGLIVNSATKSFKTALAVPTISNLVVSSITDNSAIINASVNPQNSIATFYIDYGTSSLNLYNTVNLTTQIGNNTANFSKLLTGLKYNTTYYYQIRVEYSAERDCGIITATSPISSFTTLDLTPVPPVPPDPEFPGRFGTGKSENVSVFPNPVTDVLNVVVEDDIIFVEVVDRQGKTRVVSKTSQVNVSHLAAGTYLVRVTDKNGKISTQKFNKQ
ncbi:Por secretion system C-terminal sorting domain-containing protein [Flexibacter flexilis DSM 6793]|uniref:Por secretion system C-terminal sorting domain-containing protein n=1 Tax=Flexibacter flexilis DSM 6793 TaxID=927664 RepID=A0A1I1LQW4_9BACT|nr:fibronectin type III domain-containing protein [Flexibacter flexilis]SFC75409.1 Por secretion system C-terminal sorting domain-containing protein [Flexibacter flexilis DSM 6793]